MAAKNNTEIKKQHNPASVEAAGGPVMRSFLPVNVLLVLFLIWIYIVLSRYFSVYQNGLDPRLLGALLEGMNTSVFMNILAQGAVNLLFIAVFLSALRGAGLFVVGRMMDREDINSKLEQNVLSVCVGIGIMMFVNIILGFTGLWNRYAVAGVLAVFFLMNFIKPKNTVSQAADKPAAKSQRFYLMDYLLMAAVACSFFVALMGSLTPETFYDTMKYHLALPKYWVIQQKIAVIPSFAMSYYPFNVHTLYGNILMFGGDTNAKFLNLCFGIISGALIYSMGKRLFGSRSALAALLIFATVPMTLIVSWKAVAELGLAMLELASVFFFIVYAGSSRGKIKYLVLSAVFCGLACGSKTTSVYCMLVLSAVTLYFTYQAGIKDSGLAFAAAARDAVVKTAVFLSICAVVMSPWYIRTFLETGNPTYPTFISASVKSGFMEHYVKGGLAQASDPAPVEKDLKTLLSLPWNITMGSKTQEPFSGPVFLLLLPLLLLLRLSGKGPKMILFYVTLYFVIWIMVRPYFRYAVPAVAVLSVLLGGYVVNNNMPKFARNALLLLLVYIGLRNTVFALSAEKMSMEPVKYLSGVYSRAEYLNTTRQSYPNPYYEAIEWFNTNAPVDAGILFVGECRSFYTERKYLMATISDNNPLIVWLKGSKNEDELYAKFAENHITHMLVNLPEAARLSGYEILNFDQRTLAVFARFWKKYVKESYRSIADISMAERGLYSLKKQYPSDWQKYAADPFRYVCVYEIMDKDSAARPHAVPPNMFLSSRLYSKDRWSIIESAAIEELKNAKSN